MIFSRMLSAALVLAPPLLLPPEVRAQGFSAPGQGGQAPYGGPGGQGSRPGFGAPPPPNPNNEAPRQNYADELTDFGVPPQSQLQQNVGSETPLTIPGGHVITTREMRQVINANANIPVIDVWAYGPHPSLPGAIMMPGAGSPGDFNDATQQRLWDALSNLTQRQPKNPLIFLCTGSRCWESYNAALRAIDMGFQTVLWYRGGLAAWQASGAPMSNGDPGQGGPPQQPRGGYGFGR